MASCAQANCKPCAFRHVSQNPRLAALHLTGLGWQAIFGALNPSPLAAAAALAALFVWVESRVASLLIRLAMFRDPALRAALGSHALVSTVVKATRVVGPFYLARGLSG